MSGNPQYPQKPGRGGQNRSRKNRSGKKTPFRKAPQPRPQDSLGNSLASPSQVADMMRQGEEAKSGQFAEALAGGNKPVKRERLHKVLAQSGHGSRRDMEILIAGGRVTINGNVAIAGAHVSPGDKVLIDHRLVPIRFTPEMPRVLLYHKPEGEIVSNDDPGNRISVFDNLPKVENAKWIAIGRLDFNTSGLLIFTTSGDLANKMMHPRFEVEREYAVRILGELNEEQIQRLKDGINIEGGGDDEEDEEEEQGGPRLARFTSIEARSGPDPEKSTANNWYHVIIKEGRNREIRRMFEALGLTVSRLMRVRFGKVELPPRLMRGSMQELDPGQVKDLLTWAGVSTEGMDFAAPRPQQRPGRHEKHVSKRPARPPKVSGHSRGRPPQSGQQGQPGLHGPDAPVGEATGQDGPAGRRRKSRGRKPGRKNVEGQPSAVPRPAGDGQGHQPRQGQGQGQRQRPRGRRGPVEPGNVAEGAGRPPAGKAKRGRKVRKGPRGQESPAPRIHRAERAEPLTAWTGGTSAYGRQRSEGKAARQPKIIRTVTRRPQRPEEENNS
jgi:23S rRNA pseudouridine2605 synthase